MNAFYLTVGKAGPRAIPLCLLRDYEALTAKRESLRQGLYILHDENSQLAQSDGYTLFNIGTLVYKGKWHTTALELILHDLSKGDSIESIATRSRGQFCLLTHNPQEVFVVTDRLGIIPIYKFEDLDKIEISNLLLPLARNNPVSLNKQAFAESVSFYYCLDSTLFNEIERLQMAIIYKLGRIQSVHQYDHLFDSIEFEKYSSLQEIAALAKNVLLKNISFLTSDDGIFVDVTGGFDTRLNATLLHSEGVSFKAGICGEQVLGEIDLGCQVAQALGVTFHSDIAISDRAVFDAVLEEHFAITTGVPILYHSSELINYYNHIARSFDIHITGFGGSEVMEQTLPKMRLFSSKVSKLGICMRKEWLYKDVFKNSVMDKATFYSNLSHKLDSLLKTISSNVYYHVSNALSVLDFSRNYAGCLIGTHNTILPAYSPFLEPDYVHLMLETSYELKKYHRLQRWVLTNLNRSVSDIATSHGYTVELSAGDGPGTLMKTRDGCKNLARQILYGLGLFGTKQLLDRMSRLIRPQKYPEYVHRRFWVDAVNDHWLDEMAIFEVVDRDKLDKWLKTDTQAPKLKATILYLNRMITESQCKL